MERVGVLFNSQVLLLIYLRKDYCSVKDMYTPAIHHNIFVLIYTDWYN